MIPDESEQLYGAIVSAGPDAIIVVDEAGKIVLASPAATTLFGYSPEELVGEAFEMLAPAPWRARHRQHFQRYVVSPEARPMGEGLELSGQHRDGGEFAVDVSLAPIEVRGERYVAAFVRAARERQRAIARLHAVNEVTQLLLGGTEVHDILPLVARRARDLGSADAVWIVVPATSGALEIVCADGSGTGALLGATLSNETSRSAQVMRTNRPELIDDLTVATNVPPGLAELGLGPGLYVPLIADERRLGVLVLARIRGAPQFGALDVAFAKVFATAIATALKMAQVRTEFWRHEVVSEDERIARDLHDTVIQQLFSIGMSLQGVRSSANGMLADRVDLAISNIDRVIGGIRNTIFHFPRESAIANYLREELLRLARKHNDEFGLTPTVAFRGPVDDVVTDVVSEHLLQVANEALSNAGRDARASAIEIVVAVDDGWLSLSCADDGVGIADASLANQVAQSMKARAITLGGTCDIFEREPNGTIMQWRVPVS